MKYAYLTAIIDLKFDEKLKHPVEIKKGLFVTNNSAHTAGLLPTNKIITIGQLESKLILSDCPVLFKLEDASSPIEAHTEVINLLREAQAFLTSVWLLKDNSANCELGFALCQESEHTHSNALALHYSTSEGNKALATLNSQELKAVCETHSTHFQGAREQDRTHPTNFRTGTKRLDRAGLFLQQARSADDLGQKIANYCSFFESLFSTSSSELSHQLSERCAFFLDEAPIDRLNRFKSIKKAYGVRSKIVHGDTLKAATIEELPTISKSCDDAARKSISLICSNQNISRIFSGPNDALDDFMHKLIFGMKRCSAEHEPPERSGEN